MPKDFTDYSLVILGFKPDPEHPGKFRRTFHQTHYTKKELKGFFSDPDTRKPYTYDWKGRRWVLQSTQSVQLKGWIPWLKYDPKHPFKMFYEQFRCLWARIGLLVYQEPEPEEKNDTMPSLSRELQTPRRASEDEAQGPASSEASI